MFYIISSCRIRRSLFYPFNVTGPFDQSCRSSSHVLESVAGYLRQRLSLLKSATSRLDAQHSRSTASDGFHSFWNMSFTGFNPKGSWRSWAMLLIGIMLTSFVLVSMFDTTYSFGIGLSSTKTSSHAISNGPQCSTSSTPVDVNWHTPAQSMINNLDSVVNGTGVYGFIFDSSTTPDDVPYNTYNWCNMPHVRAKEYPVPDSDYELQYVEVVSQYPNVPFTTNSLKSPDPPSPQTNTLRLQCLPT